MKALISIAFVLAAVTSVSAAPFNGTTPSYDDCSTYSVHGVWDCR